MDIAGAGPWRVRSLLLVVVLAGCGSQGLGEPQVVASGVRLYRSTDATLLDQPQPIAVSLLRLDPSRVELVSALARDEVMGREPVLELSQRHGAIAAMNAGFFLPNGDPAGVLKVGGELVSETHRPRGVVGILDKPPGRTSLVFDRITVVLKLRFETAEGRAEFEIGGVDTIRRRGELMLFTPRYHSDTDTAGNGTEWILRGSPLTVVDRRQGGGRAPIPRDGVVLSFGGVAPPPPLAFLDVGDAATIERQYESQLGTPPDTWDEAKDIVGGAGLLVVHGEPVADWTAETLREGFATERHPRSMIGVDGRGDIWLVAVDGRQPDHSVGMTFAELQRLAARIRLREALNLDGGGSTTMVVGNRIVNRPSDAEGPRPVSDALLVLERKR
jgi:hypothetical protein